MINTTTALRWMGLIGLTILMSACFSLGHPHEKSTPQYYVIDVSRGQSATHFAIDRILRIHPVRVIPHFRGRELVLRVGHNAYTPMPGHQFFEPPGEMLTAQLKHWLQQSGLFSEVTTDESRPADYVLDTAVTALYGENRPQFSPQAVLEMQFFLMDGNDASSRVLFQTGLRTEVDVPKISPPELLKGWEAGLKEIISTFEGDLSNYFLKVAPQ